MKILNIIESIILEATPDEIYNSYYKDIPKQEFDQIIMADPLSISGDSGLKRIGKYAKILINLYRKRGLKLEDLPRAKEYLEYVYKHNVSLDSNKIKSLTDLYDVVKGYYTRDTKDLNSIVASLNENEYRKVFQDGNWSIFVPLTEKSSCYLGVNTEWCTTWGPQSLNPKHKDRGSLFSRYHSQGSLYILISNKDVNDKYQFHFESKQYMDREDKRIDIQEFLNKNEDVKFFFFPSLVKDDVDSKTVQLQIDRLNALDDEDSSQVVKKIVSVSASNNPLVSALANKDLDKIYELITDDDLSELNLERENLLVSFKTSYGGDLRTTHDTLSYYQSEANSGYDMLWDRMNNEDSDYIKDTLGEFFESYYQNNYETLKTLYGYSDYEQFKNDQFDNFVEDNDMWDEYSSNFVQKNYGYYEDAAKAEAEAIEKYIDFDYYGRSRGETVYVKIPYFLLFLVKKNISSIDGKETLMEDVLNEYVSYYKIDHDYEGIWDHQTDNVTYDDLKYEIEKYFDKIFENEGGVKKCAEYRQTLNDTIQKVFKGQTRIENDEFVINIPSLKINCETGSVDIDFYNKKTGKRESGPVKVENLASYATNYKLFEDIISFRRFK